MILAGYVAAVFMGLSLGLIGGGGSILTVPILVYLFQVPPVLATAYSLFIVGLTALVGGLISARRGQVDFKTGLLFALPSFLGVYLTRAYLVPALPDQLGMWMGVEWTKSLLMMVVFALLMVAASLSMIRSPKVTSGEPAKANAKAQLSGKSRGLLILFEGLVVGAVTGFVGAGGGFLIIPALVVLVGLPMRIAVGTSLLIIASKSLIGFVGDLQSQSQMDWALLLQLSAIALVGLGLGLILSPRVPEKSLKKIFGFFVLLMGTFIFLDQVGLF